MSNVLSNVLSSIKNRALNAFKKAKRGVIDYMNRDEVLNQMLVDDIRKRNSKFNENANITGSGEYKTVPPPYQK